MFASLAVNIAGFLGREFAVIFEREIIRLVRLYHASPG
jgi:hypothetical protein